MERSDMGVALERRVRRHNYVLPGLLSKQNESYDDPARSSAVPNSGATL